MPGTYTSRLNLYKPSGSDLMSDVTNHLNANLDKLDAAQPFIRAASLPASPYGGQIAVNSAQDDTPYIRSITWFETVKIPTYVVANTGESETDITTVSTTYGAGATVVSCTFTAPANGRVWLNLSAFIENNNASRLAYLSVEVRETNAGGAIVMAAADRKGIQVQGPSGLQSTRRILVTGLTPFTQTYYAQAMLRTSNADGTATAFWRRIEAETRR